MTGKGALEIRWKSPKYQRQLTQVLASIKMEIPKYQRQLTQALASIKMGEKRKDPMEHHGESGATCLGVGLILLQSTCVFRIHLLGFYTDA